MHNAILLEFELCVCMREVNQYTQRPSLAVVVMWLCTSCLFLPAVRLVHGWA